MYMSNRLTGRLLPYLVSCLLLGAAARGADRPLQVLVLEGEGAFNDINKGTARAPVVEVRDENGKVVPEARVVFHLPEMGPSGTFADGSRVFVASTDREGRAGAIGLKPNRVEGPFQIIVTVSAGARTGRAEVRETNTLAGGDRAMKSGHGRLLGILLAVAGAAGGGIIAATRGGGGSSSSGTAAAAVPTTLSAGTVTIGGPR
jgi:hypothetical protein